MAGPMPGENIDAYRQRRREEMAHERGEGPAPANSGFEQKKAHVASRAAERKARPMPGRALNIDTAAEDADAAAQARNHGSRGGIQPMDMAKINAADAELVGKKGSELKAIGEQREESARVAGRSRFDIDKPPVQSAVSASPQLPKAAPSPNARSSTRASVTSGADMSGRVMPNVQAQLPQKANLRNPEVRAGVVNPTIAPTHESAPEVPEPAAQATRRPQRYGRPDSNGQGTLFGVTGYGGNKEQRKQASRGLAFGDAVEQEHASGPIKGDQALLTDKGNPTRAARNPAYTTPKPVGPPSPGMTQRNTSQPSSQANPSTYPLSPGASPSSLGPHWEKGADGRHVRRQGAPPDPNIAKVAVAVKAIGAAMGGNNLGRTPVSASSPPGDVHLNPVQASASSGEDMPGNPAGTRRLAAGRTAVLTPRNSGPGGGVHIAGDNNIVGNNSGNTTHNTYTYHVGGDNYGSMGGGSGIGRQASGRPGSQGHRGPREVHEDHADIWVRDVNGVHSARHGFETLTGQRNSTGELTHTARTYRAAHQAQAAGGTQRPIAGSGRTHGATGTGTTFNWTGPTPTMGTASTGGTTGTFAPNRTNNGTANTP